MHGVAAVEVHAVWHPGAIEMAPGWSMVFSVINVRSDYVAMVINVITEHARDMVAIF